MLATPKKIGGDYPKKRAYSATLLDSDVQVEQLKAELPDRFKNNLKLKREIVGGLREEPIRMRSGAVLQTGVISVDPVKIARLFEMMAQGFYYHERNVSLATAAYIRAKFFPAKEMDMIARIMLEARPKSAF